jgi:hypothetical protein
MVVNPHKAGRKAPEAIRLIKCASNKQTILGTAGRGSRFSAGKTIYMKGKSFSKVMDGSM